MKETYDEAMTQVFKDEGGYSNDANDPGGPTNWGITLHDARLYWKPTATAEDVQHMPKSVAEEIMRKHYATPVQYDVLNPGVDYAVLDYGINSGVYRAAEVLQRLVGVPVDGQIGPVTVAAANKKDSKQLINQIYDERLAFLQSLSTWGTFGHGWTNRVNSGRTLALSMVDKYKPKVEPTTVPIIVGGGVAAAGAGALITQYWDWLVGHQLEVVAITSVVAAATAVGVHLWKRK